MYDGDPAADHSVPADLFTGIFGSTVSGNGRKDVYDVFSAGLSGSSHVESPDHEGGREINEGMTGKHGSKGGGRQDEKNRTESKGINVPGQEYL